MGVLSNFEQKFDQMSGRRFDNKFDNKFDGKFDNKFDNKFGLIRTSALCLVSPLIIPPISSFPAETFPGCD